MSRFRILPLAPTTADHVRTHGTDPVWGHSATGQVATGFGPCRVCLHTFVEGKERRLLFTHDTYAGIESHVQPGPVYIHETPCQPYQHPDRFPDDLRPLALTFEALARGRRVREVVMDTGDRAEEIIAGLLARPGIDYVHVRNTTAGCYVLRAARAARAARAEPRDQTADPTEP